MNAGMAIRAQWDAPRHPSSLAPCALRNAGEIFAFAAIGFSSTSAVCIIDISKPKQFAKRVKP
jgi:hypothetical protein